MRASISFPKAKKLDIFIKKQITKPYSYPEVGATATDTILPTYYDNDHNFIELGQGEKVWGKAKVALQNWQQFPLPWTKIYPNTMPLEKGKIVAVLFSVFGLWWRNSAKIVYTFDEPNRFGFAYGTLPVHVEMGEEVFWIERNKQGHVSYHIKAFSRPAFWMTKLVYPIARMYQRRFVKDSMAQMKRLCS